MEPNRLILVNGAPGSGKSTVAVALAAEVPLMLALDVDTMKHALGRWEDTPLVSGNRARAICIAAAGEHLEAGYDVIVSQYLARTSFIEDLETLAARHTVQFTEIVLELDPGLLAERLRARVTTPDRIEHMINNRFVGPDDAVSLAKSLEPLRKLRPNASWIDAAGSVGETVDRIREVIRAMEREKY